MDVAVEVLPEAQHGEWSRLVRDSPDGSIYSLPEYLDILCRTAGGRFAVLVVRRRGELAGGAAVYERPSRHGLYVEPRRLLHYNGLVLRRYATRYPSEQTARQLKTMSALAAALGHRGYAWTTLVCPSSVTDVRPFLAAGWTAEPRYTYVVPIADRDLVWSRIEQNLRRLIGRCDRAGFVVADDDDFESFYGLHARTMERLEADTYLPRAAFREYFRALRAAGLCRLFQARSPDGRVAATQLVLLGSTRLTHTVAAAAHPDFAATGVSAFVRWRAFRALGEAGYEANDLTDASLSPVTHFKSQLGGELRLSLALEAPRKWSLRASRGVAGASRRALRVLGGAARRAMGQA
jgi:hypothetical protein